MRVLFLCRGNRHRSPIAEALFQKMYLAEKAESTGFFERRQGEFLPIDTIQSLLDGDIDTGRNKTRLCTEKMIKAADKVIAFAKSNTAPSSS